MVENGTSLGRSLGVCGFALLVVALSACGGSSKSEDDDAAGGQTHGAGSGGTRAGVGGAGATSGRGAGGSTANGGKGGSVASGATGGAAGSGTSGTGGRAGEGAGGGAGPLGGSGGTSAGAGPVLGLPSTDFLPLRRTTFGKLDLLLMIDNSLSMAGKQNLLADAVPYLVRRLAEPPCIGSDGTPTGASADAKGSCSDGEPAFAPMGDLHIGIVTSSLGDHGSNDVCSDAQNQSNIANGNAASNYNDMAQLLGSVRQGIPDFLSWGPSDDLTSFQDQAVKEVEAVGEHGCGYEASLEAWYRFLVDPEPVANVGNDMAAYTVRPSQTNDVLLAERAAFLRDDSVLGIVLLSDENDCSILDENQTEGWLVGYKGGVGKLTWHMPHATSPCATDPNDPCCAPCATPPKSGCADPTTDPACSELNLSVNEDSMNLRCFAQKQRFGVDLLYPTSRYVEALTSTSISPRLASAGATRNPLFSARQSGVLPRSPAEVVFMAIVGVPWQDASSADSWSGRDLTYLDADELAAENRWAVMLGDPATNVLPTDTLMVESIDPRTAGPLPQTHPLLAGVKLASPASTSDTNVINGHEQNVLPERDDLQFSCIFPLASPVSPSDCARNSDACDCNADEFDKNSPLCQGVTATTDGSQVYGKAYPGVRELEVVKGIGDAGIVASICPKNTTAMGDKSLDDAYGYNPAMAAFVERLGPRFTPMCLPVSLAVTASDPTHLACHVVEIPSNPADGASCDCASYGLSNAGAGPTAKAYDYLRAGQFCGDAPQVACGRYCVCEIPELTGAALADCQSAPDYSGSDEGFCYLDPAQGAGSLDALGACPPSKKRTIRFSGDAPTPNDATFVDCAPDDN
jgi:hypothetical protein